MNIQNFIDQIKEDIAIIQAEWSQADQNFTKSEYAFNFWVLSKLYNIDDEIIPQQITDYQDKGIDCWAHYEDSKELFIIQNKYFSEETTLDTKEITYFLNTPIKELNEGNYKRSQELQKIYKSAINDPEYKIWLHFYLTTDSNVNNFRKYFENYNKEQISQGAIVKAEIYGISEIYDLYFGKSFKEKISFNYTLTSFNKGTVLQLLPEEYKISNMSVAYFIMTPITQIYDMFIKSIERGYPLFEENIREYLGRSNVNSGIIKTLKDPKERYNFFYYNNGITFTATKEPKKGTQQGYNIELVQPQVINGCQTVNTIKEVLEDYSPEELKTEFKNVSVMVKVIIIDNKINQTKPNFAKDIVKFTNKQNSLNEKAFAATASLFSSLQTQFLDRGFLLLVKPSDSVKFKEEYGKRTELNKILKKSQEEISKIGVEVNSFKDLIIPLEKLLQVYLALVKDGYFAFTKKEQVLKPTSEIYSDFSVNIHNVLQINNMIRLYLLYKKAEIDKANSQDKKTPIPYYVIGFLGYLINNKESGKLNEVFDKLFERENDILERLYRYLGNLTKVYKFGYGEEYNSMIKKPIKLELLEQKINDQNVYFENDKELMQFLYYLKN